MVSVSDATRSLNIEVSPRDIKSSTARNHKVCAFAAACKRAKHLDGAIIAVKIAYMIKDGKATRYSIPESLSREIVAFDRNGAFSAGGYRLDKPKRKLGDPTARGSENRKSKGRKVKYRHATQGIRSLRNPS